MSLLLTKGDGSILDEVALTQEGLTYETGVARDIFESARAHGSDISDESLYAVMRGWSNGYLTVAEVGDSKDTTIVTAADRDYVRDNDGQFADVPGVGNDGSRFAARVDNPGDKLSLRRKLPEGVTVRSSAKGGVDDGHELMIAEVDTPDGPQLRVGAVPQDDLKRWAAGYADPRSEERRAEIEDELAEMAEEDDDSSEATEYQVNLEAELEELGAADDEVMPTAVFTPEGKARIHAELGRILEVGQAANKERRAEVKEREALEEEKLDLIETHGDEELEQDLLYWENQLSAATSQRARSGGYNEPRRTQIREESEATMALAERELAEIREARLDGWDPAAVDRWNEVEGRIAEIDAPDLTDTIASGSVDGEDGSGVEFELQGSESENRDGDWSGLKMRVRPRNPAPGWREDQELSGTESIWGGPKDIKKLMAKFAPGEPTTAAAYPEPVVFLPGELWHAIAHTEGVSTGHRVWLPGAISWRQPPFALHWEYSTAAHGGQMMTVQVGLVTRMERVGDQIHAWGTIDLGATDGAEVGRKLAAGFARWVSMGPGIEGEGRPGTIVYDTVYPAHLTPEEWGAAQPEQVVFREFPIGELTIVSVPAQEGADIGPSPELLALMGLGEQMTSYNDVVVAGGSLLDQERRPEAQRALRARRRAEARASGTTVLARDGRPEITTAGGSWVVEIPDLPEAWMFDKPDIAPGTPPTITDDGRFFGYFAPAKTAHRSYARMGVRKEVSTLNRTDYSRFLRNVPVAGGGTALAGPITMECMHAPTQDYGTLDRRHQAYEDTCSIVARANIGEDPDGGRWFAGVLEPGLTAAQLRKLTVSQLSLDSQPHPEQPGMQDFVAILVVPTPGWPTSTRIDGSQVAHTIRETQDGPVVTASCAPIVFTAMVAPPAPPAVDPSVVLFFAQQVGLDPVSQIQAAARALEGV